MANTAAGLDNGQLQTLHIAAAPRLATGLVGRTIQRLVANGNRGRFSVDSRERVEIERWVGSSRYDIGLASLPVTFKGVKVVPFAEVDAVIVMRRDDPLAGSERLAVGDIADRPMIVTVPGSLVRERTISTFANAGSRFNPRIEVANSPLAAQYVAQGLGLFILDGFSAIEQDSILTTVPLSAGFSQRVGFLLPMGRDRPPAVTEFMHTAREVAEESGARLL